MSKEKAQKNLNMTNILPSNILQATPIFPVSSVTSQWAVTHIKLRLIEP
jgi:hypothetical protein